MTFWQIFFRVLPKRPLKALGALYWHVTRRRVRARNRLLVASASLPFVYDLWISTIEETPKVAAEAPRMIETWARQPSFGILLYQDADLPEEQRRLSIRSVEKQIYPSRRLLDCANSAEINADYVVPLRVGDLLSESALFRFAEALQSENPASILYGDHDELSHRGRRRKPWFKPRWNAEMFLALDFMSQSVAIESSLAARIGFCRDKLTRQQLDAALLQATSESAGRIVHIPHVLTHVRSDDQGSHRHAAVAQHLHKANAGCEPGPFGTAKVSWPLPADLPLVSILIPTKDKLELLRPCVNSVLEKTSYGAFEIIIVDNGSALAETLAFFDEISGHPGVTILSYDAPYNFSAINNFAARHADGSILCLLNNDTEVLEPHWLTEMVRYAAQPGVGAVGAKLLYDDGSIQHAGVVVGVGEAAGHAHRFARGDQPGYFRQPHVSQYVTAVTAACLAVAKEKYEAVGGLDEEHLAVAFNDVDLCLKLQEAGFKNVYVPHALLLHHESKSRGSDFAPERVEQYRRELKTLQERWGTKTYQDPLHNPNLDRYSETYVIRI